MQKSMTQKIRPLSLHLPVNLVVVVELALADLVLQM
jgi:hypothetical protein